MLLPLHILASEGWRLTRGSRVVQGSTSAKGFITHHHPRKELLLQLQPPLRLAGWPSRNLNPKQPQGGPAALLRRPPVESV